MRFVVTNLDVEKFGTNVSKNGEQFGTLSGKVCGNAPEAKVR